MKKKNVDIEPIQTMPLIMAGILLGRTLNPRAVPRKGFCRPAAGADMSLA